MPVALITQKDLRQTQKLSFCYLCGQRFGPSHDGNRDHVPPSGLFAQPDRNLPLILRTHYRCNEDRSQEDQSIGQLVGLLHGRQVNPAHNKLRIVQGKFKDGTPAAALRDLDIPAVIRRWIRGFHAALYREYLPENTLFGTYSPFPEARHVNDQVVFAPIQDVFPKFVEELKRNRVVENLDRIVCNNTKCRYECVWSQADDGRWICIYCLDLYSWAELGDTNKHTPRGCVGFYRRLSGGVPLNASTTTCLVFNVKNAIPFDPFTE